jgi:VanZ family protein
MDCMTPKETRSIFLRRWGPAVLIMAAIFAFSSIPSEDMPRFGAFDLSLKKGGHMLGYALLTRTYLRGIAKTRPGAPWLAGLLAVVYAATDEIHQSWVPGRGARVADVMIDAVGAFLGAWSAFWILPRRGKARNQT